MNCCDEYGDCRQGRECPARMPGVAPVGRKRPAQGDAITPQEFVPWRRHLEAVAPWALVVIILMTLAGTALRVAWGLI